MTRTITEKEATIGVNDGEIEKIQNGYGEMCVFVDDMVAMPGRSMQMMFTVDEWIYLMEESQDLEGGKEKDIDIRGETINIENQGKGANYIMKHLTANYESRDAPPKTYYTQRTIDSSLNRFQL